MITESDRRRARVRSKLYGTAQRPRLSVRISNRHVFTQLIDDEAGRTLAAASTLTQKGLEPNLTKRAEWAGVQIAQAAKQHKIKRVVFDRGGKLYHGRLHALAEAARKEGLEF